jgi:tRNA pseudouridine65 synthase
MEILYQDPYLIAVNKPHGLLVHRSKMANDASEFALQKLRDQIGKHVFPAHRLDRKTSGVLLFSLDKATNSLMHKQFSGDKIRKIYLAIVRGHTSGEGIIDYPLTKENGKVQEAVTRYVTLGHAELDFPSGKHPTSRYSLVKAIPETGRMHQIRKHFAHIFHPIIGDRPHGCNKQNRLFKEKFNMTTMLLHAWQLNFSHPVNGNNIKITAPPSEAFFNTCRIMGFEHQLQQPENPPESPAQS